MASEHLIRFVAGLGLLRRDPGGLRYLAPFVRSLLPGHSPLRDVVPMMPYRAVTWLREYLEPGMRVFEYGSGGSTVFFASRAQEVVSVEHDPDWYARTGARLRELGLTNVTYLLELPQAGRDDKFSSTDFRYRDRNFAAYVKTIDRYPDHHFNLVSVDGRARVACVLGAIAKVRKGGYLLLDDAARAEYAPALESLASFPRTDYPGISPSNTDLGLTAVWKIT